MFWSFISAFIPATHGDDGNGGSIGKWIHVDQQKEGVKYCIYALHVTVDTDR
jgi:hypothetical protein